MARIDPGDVIDAVVKEFGATEIVLGIGDAFSDMRSIDHLISRNIMLRGEHGVLGGTIETIAKVYGNIWITVTRGQYVGDLDESKKERQNDAEDIEWQFVDLFEVEDKIKLLLLPQARGPVKSSLMIGVRPESRLESRPDSKEELKGKRGANGNTNVAIAPWDTDRNWVLSNIEGYKLEAKLLSIIDKEPIPQMQSIAQQLLSFRAYDAIYVPAQAGVITQSSYLPELRRAKIWNPEKKLSKYYFDILQDSRPGFCISYDNSIRQFNVNDRPEEVLNRVRTNVRLRTKPAQALIRQTLQTDPAKKWPIYRVFATVFDEHGNQLFEKVEVSNVLYIRQGRDKIARLVVTEGPGISFFPMMITAYNIEVLLEEERVIQDEFI